MNRGHDLIDEAVLLPDVSDEALESVAGGNGGMATLTGHYDIHGCNFTCHSE